MSQKHYVVCVRDGAMAAFTRPFIVPHRQLAVRSFTDEVNRPEGEMYKHPGDYELYCLGTWEEVSGRFENLQTPELLVRGKDISKREAANVSE